MSGRDQDSLKGAALALVNAGNRYRRIRDEEWAKAPDDRDLARVQAAWSDYLRAVNGGAP